jgi:hypothetical protein
LLIFLLWLAVVAVQPIIVAAAVVQADTEAQAQKAAVVVVQR